MDIYEVEEFFKGLNPGKNVTLSFPPKCHRVHELIYTEGKPNPNHHLECHHVQVEVEGKEPTIVKIMPHRMTLKHEDMKSIHKDMFMINNAE